jgi:hypothetical protein
MLKSAKKMCRTWWICSDQALFLAPVRSSSHLGRVAAPWVAPPGLHSHQSPATERHQRGHDASIASRPHDPASGLHPWMEMEKERWASRLVAWMGESRRANSQPVMRRNQELDGRKSVSICNACGQPESISPAVPASSEGLHDRCERGGMAEALRAKFRKSRVMVAARAWRSTAEKAAKCPERTNGDTVSAEGKSIRG